MIITITLNPALDRTIRIDHPLSPRKLNRAFGSMVEPGGKGINVSRAIKALGGTSVALGFSAGSNGRMMKDALTSADIHHDFVDVPGETRINIQLIDTFATIPKSMNRVPKSVTPIICGSSTAWITTCSRKIFLSSPVPHRRSSRWMAT